MKNIFLTSVVAIATLTSCSTVSSIMQNTFPYNASFIITSGSPANSQLSSVSTGINVNQITGANSNVKDIRIAASTVSITNGNQGMGVFKSVKLYLSSNGGNEVLVASRDNISDNIGNSLSLDVNNNSTLDNIIKSGGVQQRLVYVLKTSPTSDLNVKSSINFSSVPAN